jgi:TM2 domain-containing membrane protein YozV
MKSGQSVEIRREKAIRLAITLGWLGGHRFYTGQTVSALAYMLFFWTLVPGLLSLIDAFFLAHMSDDDFADEFCPLPTPHNVAAQKPRFRFKGSSTDLSA